MSEASGPSPDAVKHYLDESIPVERLYEMLADSAGLGADEIDKSGEGRTLFSRLWRRYGKNVCANPIVQAYIGNPDAADTVAVMTHILGVFAAVKGVNIALVAALSLRLGLRMLCAEPPQ